MSPAPYEQFSAASDELLQTGSGEAAGSLSDEIAIAQRLRSTAGAGIPDPQFVLGLREELRLQAEARLRPAAASLRYATVDTAFGLLAFAYQDAKVVYCSRLEPSRADLRSLPIESSSAHPAADAFARTVARDLGAWPERDEAPPPALERAIREQLAGRRRTAPVDLSRLPEFQRRVLEKTAEIPRGEVRPYGWVASELGAPGAVRAVGTALGHNPVPFLIPCHRVVRSDGTLGEYSGGGPAIKQRVLEIEGAPMADLLQAARSGQRYRGSRTTHIVCYPSCHAAQRIQIENAVPFATLRQARDYGYRPCSLCRPA